MLCLQEENAQMREQLGLAPRIQGSKSQLHLTRSDFEVLEAAKEAVGEVHDEDEGVGEHEGLGDEEGPGEEGMDEEGGEEAEGDEVEEEAEGESEDERL